MSEKLLNKQALIDANDLTTTSTTAKYPLGFEVETIDGSDIRKYIYVKAGIAVSKKDIVVVNPGFSTVAPATSAFGRMTGVANIDVAANSFFFAQIKGKTTATSAGATTSGHFTKLITALETVTDSSSVVASTNAVINETLASAGDVSITLLGIPSEIAAS